MNKQKTAPGKKKGKKGSVKLMNGSGGSQRGFDGMNCYGYHNNGYAVYGYQSSGYAGYGYQKTGNNLPSVRTQTPVSSGSVVSKQPLVEVAKIMKTEMCVSEFGPKIEELLVGKKLGMFAAQVEIMYQKIWSYKLPSDWVEIMERERGMKVVHKGVTRENPVCSLVDRVTTVSREEQERNWEDIVSRVESILYGRVYGWFVSQVEKAYIKQHMESLPDGWVSKLEELGKLVTDRSKPGNVVCSLPNTEAKSRSEVCSLPNTGVVKLSPARTTTSQNTPFGRIQSWNSSEIKTSTEKCELDICVSLPELDLVPSGLSVGDTWFLPQVCMDMDSPNLEDYYDVRVSLVLEGDLVFFLQSYMNREIYDGLQEDMKRFYSIPDNKVEVTETLLTKGSYLAVWYKERWERGRVLGCLLGGRRWSVRLVDTGHFIVCFNTNLVQPLWIQFGRIPEAARCARLSEVRPIVGEDWSKESKDWFRHRVEGKDLVAVVESMKEDLMYVRLVDTSNEQLQWGEDIGEQMVSLSQARWKKNVLR